MGATVPGIGEIRAVVVHSGEHGLTWDAARRRCYLCIGEPDVEEGLTVDRWSPVRLPARRICGYRVIGGVNIIARPGGVIIQASGIKPNTVFDSARASEQFGRSNHAGTGRRPKVNPNLPTRVDFAGVRPPQSVCAEYIGARPPACEMAIRKVRMQLG